VLAKRSNTVFLSSTNLCYTHHNMYESLHNHTVTSDGTEEYLATLKSAARHQVTTVAFTDHDALPNEAALAALRSYTGPLTWTIGIEVSSGGPVERPDISGLHIVGHFVDVEDAALREHCTKAQAARKERMERIVKNLTEQGFLITEEDCLSASGGESVGRPHIVSALLSHPENHQRLMELKAEMKADATAVEAYTAMEERVAVRGVSEYVYSLLLANEPYIPGVYVDYLYSLNMDESVALIRGAGGVALLAHWWCYEQKLSLDTLREYLVAGRLDGIEVIGGFGEQSAAAYPALKTVAEETNCLVSVGADAHKPEHFELYTKMPCVEATKGVFKTLFDRVQPERACTNYQG
jgi:predicted metal-dependent phosphoesterase TrpH